MTKKILIPTDGSAYGKVAIEYGIYVARKLDAQLLGLHVLDIRLMQGPVITDVSGSVGLPPYQEFIPVLESGLEERADAILDAFFRQCEEGGIHPEVKKTIGLIDEAIIEEGQKADWVLLAQRGDHIHIGKGGLLGTTAEAVVRNAGKPVMVTPAVFREIESMGLAYDGSPPARHALRLAVEISREAGWPLTAIVVTDDHRLGATLTTEVESSIDASGIDGDVVILRGKEEVQIIRYIQQGAIELMVMGAYGHNRLRELLLGSTTSFIIRRSTIPVLLTR